MAGEGIVVFNERCMMKRVVLLFGIALFLQECLSKICYANLASSPKTLLSQLDDNDPVVVENQLFLSIFEGNSQFVNEWLQLAKERNHPIHWDAVPPKDLYFSGPMLRIPLLPYSVSTGNLEIVRALVLAGAPLNLFYPVDRLPLYQAFFPEDGKPSQVDLIKFLIENGASLSLLKESLTLPKFLAKLSAVNKDQAVYDSLEALVLGKVPAPTQIEEEKKALPSPRQNVSLASRSQVVMAPKTRYTRAFRVPQKYEVWYVDLREFDPNAKWRPCVVLTSRPDATNVTLKSKLYVAMISSSPQRRHYANVKPFLLSSDVPLRPGSMIMSTSLFQVPIESFSGFRGTLDNETKMNLDLKFKEEFGLLEE